MKVIWFATVLSTWCLAFAGFIYGAWLLLRPDTFCQRFVAILVAFVAWVSFFALWGISVRRTIKDEQ